MITIVYGLEPYFLDQKKKDFLKQSPTAKRFKAFDQEAVHALMSMDLFQDENSVLVELSKCSELNRKEFLDYIERPELHSQLLILIKENAENAKVLQNQVVRKNCSVLAKNKISLRNLEQFVLRIIQNYGKRIKREVFSEVLARVGYLQKKEMTLYDVENQVTNLCDAILGEEIPIEVVEEMMPPLELPNRFGLARMLKNNDCAGVFKQVQYLSGESEIGILMLLVRELRISAKKKYFANNEIDVKGSVFDSYSAGVLSQAMNVLLETVRAIKSGEIPENMALMIAVNRLMRVMNG